MGCFHFPHQAAQTSGTGKLMTHVTPVNTDSRCQHICHSLTSASIDVQKPLAVWHNCSTSMTLHARYTRYNRTINGNGSHMWTTKHKTT